MSLIPTFQMGLWNAWIIQVAIFLTTTIPSMIDKETTKKRMGEFKWSELGRTEKIVLLITHVIIIPFTIIYSYLPTVEARYYMVVRRSSYLCPGPTYEFHGWNPFCYRPAWWTDYQGRLPHLKTSYIFLWISVVSGNSNSLRFLDFFSMRHNMDSLDALRSISRRMCTSREVWGRIPQVYGSYSKMDRNTEIGGTWLIWIQILDYQNLLILKRKHSAAGKKISYLWQRRSPIFCIFYNNIEYLCRLLFEEMIFLLRTLIQIIIFNYIIYCYNKSMSILNYS